MKEKYEILPKCLNYVELWSSVQSRCQKNNLVNTNNKVAKKGD